jgi:hypothetical protein
MTGAQFARLFDEQAHLRRSTFSGVMRLMFERRTVRKLLRKVAESPTDSEASASPTPAQPFCVTSRDGDGGIIEGF